MRMDLLILKKEAKKFNIYLLYLHSTPTYHTYLLCISTFNTYLIYLPTISKFYTYLPYLCSYNIYIPYLPMFIPCFPRRFWAVVLLSPSNFTEAVVKISNVGREGQTECRMHHPYLLLLCIISIVNNIA